MYKLSLYANTLAPLRTNRDFISTHYIPNPMLHPTTTNMPHIHESSRQLTHQIKPLPIKTTTVQISYEEFEAIQYDPPLDS